MIQTQCGCLVQIPSRWEGAPKSETMGSGGLPVYIEEGTSSTTVYIQLYIYSSFHCLRSNPRTCIAICTRYLKVSFI